MEEAKQKKQHQQDGRGGSSGAGRGGARGGGEAIPYPEGLPHQLLVVGVNWLVGCCLVGCRLVVTTRVLVVPPAVREKRKVR